MKGCTRIFSGANFYKFYWKPAGGQAILKGNIEERSIVSMRLPIRISGRCIVTPDRRVFALCIAGAGMTTKNGMVNLCKM